MKPQKLTLDFKGLVTAPGNLASAPGALLQAQNVDFPAPGLAVKRKGLGASKGHEFTGPCWAALSTPQLGDQVLFLTGGSGGTTLQYGDGASATTTISTPDATNPAGTATLRMKAATSLRNHYLTSVRAVGRLQSDMSFKWAGMPRSPGMHWRQQNETQLDSAASWLADNYAVAYRVVWVTTDVDGVEIVSAPSGRWVVANIAATSGYTGAGKAVKLNLRLPYQADTNSTAITTSWRVRLYRSFSVDVGDAQPNDEMQLCWESAPTEGEIIAGYMTVVDTCPEAALGAYLYTNTVSGGDVTGGMVRPTSTSLGMAASNDGPPLAQDVAVFADCMFYANFATRMRYRFSILGTGTGALEAGDDIDIDGTTYTAVAGAPATTLEFRVETGFSVALNIRQTAMNFVAAINSSHPTVTAAYIGSDASPGTIGAILLERRRSDDDTAFTANVTTGVTTCYLPPLNGTTASTQDAWGNGLCMSKPFQADAVPPANYLRVGRNDATIQRIVPLRDALYIFTSDGIYWVRGSQPSDFVIEAFDVTFRLLARDACVTVGDAIYAWGREGIARITNGGVEFLDLPIRNYVAACQRGLLASLSLDEFAGRAFAVAYPVARKVLFFFPQGTEYGGIACSRALVYHVSTNTWSTYRFDPEDNATLSAKLCACVRWSDELLVCGEDPTGTNSLLYVERNAANANDYADTAMDGDDAGIVSTLQWLAVTPNPAETCHWSELQLYLSPDPTNTSLDMTGIALSATVASEHGGSVTASLSVNATDTQLRLMLSQDVGIAARQTVTLTHGEKLQWFASSGFGLLYAPVSNFMVR